jgi:hypothetical protein
LRRKIDDQKTATTHITTRLRVRSITPEFIAHANGKHNLAEFPKDLLGATIHQTQAAHVIRLGKLVIHRKPAFEHRNGSDE